MKLKEIISYLEEIAPIASQEDYDNSGLICGDSTSDITNALISLDCTEAVIQEAKNKNCNLVICHHPIVFKGLKKINGKNYVERTIVSAIKNDIAIYAIHTNLDNSFRGVNAKIGQKIGLKNFQILKPMSETLFKLITFVPISHTDSILDVLFKSGAGSIGNYSECSFTVEGKGTFKASENTNPFVGDKGKRHFEIENKIEVVLTKFNYKKIVDALIKSHPYEEVAYDILPIKNASKQHGSGMIGDLENEMGINDFFHHLKKAFNLSVVRYSGNSSKKIKRVAWCGGSGIFLLNEAKLQGADIFITGDVKYHDFFDAENQIIIADIGHFESEQYTIELLSELLQEKFPTFAPCIVETNTNPVKYF